MNRRYFLSAGVGFIACTGSKTTEESCTQSTSLSLLEDGSHLPEASFDENPFSLGVASGGVLADRVILWTRIAPDPLAEDGLGGVSTEAIRVEWEVSTKEDFSEILLYGVVATTEQLAHAVHIDAGPLEPDSWYYYRFKCGGWISAVGKTRTLPCKERALAQLRLGVTTCHRYEDGYFTVLGDLALQEPDIVLQVGDYIYEYAPSEDVRVQPLPRCSDLTSYRLRHALYKGEAELQAAHASCPWEVVWDDHEIKNDYFGSDEAEEIQELMRAGYQAYYEHMPLRVLPPEGSTLKIYRVLDIGNLLRIYLFDTRQYRDETSCGDDDCPDMFDGDRQLLGEEQESWFLEEVESSSTRWNLIAQQVVMSNFNISEALLNYDQWDGYPAARERILEHLYALNLNNFLVCTGDIHIGGVARLNLDPDDFTSPVVAYEFVTPSVTSSARELEDNGALVEYALSARENVDYIHATKRGYILLDITHEQIDVSFRMVDSVEEPDLEVKTEASFQVVHAGFTLTKTYDRREE